MTHHPKHRYEVHTYTLLDGWVNCWSVSEPNGDDYPDSFETVRQAQDAIDEFFADINSEIESGQRQMDEAYDRSEFCIYDAVDKLYIP